MSDLRQPAVAGYFYPKDTPSLQKQIADFIQPSKTKKALGVMCPHAGYIYSGKVAGEVYAQVKIPKKVIILAPNHTGLGVPFSIYAKGAWQTPLGKVEIDEELSSKIMAAFPYLLNDHLAHVQEHSLEVQIPFLQSLQPELKIVAITLAHVGLEHCLDLGEALAKVIEESSEEILIVASSDMNHYKEHQQTLKLDQLAIDEILKRDPQKLYEVVHKEKITMCGIIPTTVMLEAANILGAKKATLVDHTTSGPVSGDYNKVVGYAGIIVT